MRSFHGGDILMKTENCSGSRDGNLSKVPSVRYSAADPTGRELMEGWRD